MEFENDKLIGCLECLICSSLLSIDNFINPNLTCCKAARKHLICFKCLTKTTNKFWNKYWGLDETNCFIFPFFCWFCPYCQPHFGEESIEFVDALKNYNEFKEKNELLKKITCINCSKQIYKNYNEYVLNYSSRTKYCKDCSKKCTICFGSFLKKIGENDYRKFCNNCFYQGNKLFDSKKDGNLKIFLSNLTCCKICLKNNKFCVVKTKEAMCNHHLAMKLKGKVCLNCNCEFNYKNFGYCLSCLPKCKICFTYLDWEYNEKAQLCSKHLNFKCLIQVCQNLSLNFYNQKIDSNFCSNHNIGCLNCSKYLFSFYEMENRFCNNCFLQKCEICRNFLFSKNEDLFFETALPLLEEKKLKRCQDCFYKTLIKKCLNCELKIAIFGENYCIDCFNTCIICKDSFCTNNVDGLKFKICESCLNDNSYNVFSKQDLANNNLEICKKCNLKWKSKYSKCICFEII